MPSAGTKKNTSTNKRKKNTGGSKNTRTSGYKRKTTQKKKQSGNGLELEILVLVMLGVSILLLIGNLDMGGSVGEAVSRFFFGLLGWIEYLFPFFLFFGSAFVVANRKNRLIFRKTAGLLLVFVCLAGLIHMFTLGYSQGDTVSGYYQYCSVQKTGGGIVGGGLAKLLSIAFGTLGAYVVLAIGLVIAVIIMTQRPVLAPLKEKSEKLYQETKKNHNIRKEERRRISFEQMKIQEPLVEETKASEEQKGKRKQKKQEAVF